MPNKEFFKIKENYQFVSLTQLASVKNKYSYKKHKLFVFKNKKNMMLFLFYCFFFKDQPGRRNLKGNSKDYYEKLYNI